MQNKEDENKSSEDDKKEERIESKQDVVDRDLLQVLAVILIRFSVAKGVLFYDPLLSFSRRSYTLIGIEWAISE